MCSLKTMAKEGEKYTPKEVTTEEEKFKAMLFFLREYESRYGQLFQDMRKSYFVGIYQHPGTINGSY